MAVETVKVQGMHCVDCAHKVEEAIRRVPGVHSVHVHYLKKQAQIEEDGSIDWDALRRAVQEAGYDVVGPASAG